MTQRKWIDVSVPLETGMVHWPDNPPVDIHRMKDMACGDSANVSVLSMGSHTGTHMDAPVHFIRGGRGIDALPFDATLGPARVVLISDRRCVRPEELRTLRIRRGERLLFRTRNSTRCWKTRRFIEDFVFVSREAAAYLVQRGVRTVGVDYLSVGGFREDAAETHQILLRAGVWIIEGLNLSRIKPGRYDLLCLPLKIAGGDGAPARALLRRRS